MKKTSLYSVHPSVAYARAILDNLPKTTGKPLGEWAKLLEKEGPSDGKTRKDWLKSKHGLGTTTASMIAGYFEGKGKEATDPGAYLEAATGYVDSMYAGKKALLRPLHDALVGMAQTLGGEVKICPCQTIVPLYRKNVFAQIKPATLTRIDLGLALKGCDKPLPVRLIDTGGLQKGDRITHRFVIRSLDDIDGEVKEWLSVAFELNA